VIAIKARPDHTENLMIAGLVVLVVAQGGLMVWNWLT